MIELIFSIILVLSLISLGVILFRRIPDLVKVEEPQEAIQNVVLLKIKERAKSFPGIKNFSYELYLQKILSRVRVLTLKTDSKTSGWLERLRKKQDQNNGNNNDNYWEELKKAKDGK